jgi:hypothetical protein
MIPNGDLFYIVSPLQNNISDTNQSYLPLTGLLMAVFVAEGEEVASVNMVVNVTKVGDNFIREILNPLS